MTSLKEIKTRITSVRNTRKITNAMKMVASSKLHHAQKAIENMLPYEKRLFSILDRFLETSEDVLDSIYSYKRDVKSVAIIVISSNSSLCGAFNANILKEFERVESDYRKNNIDINVFPIGVKIAKALKKKGYTFDSNNSDLLDKPVYSCAENIAEKFMSLFESGEVDKVDVIYHHFVNSSKQNIVRSQFLPIDFGSFSLSDVKVSNVEKRERHLDYILEPGAKEILSSLIPSSLHIQIFSSVLDSLASEHAARVMAMQIATDNADDLLDQLTLTYNKTRQQSITNELLDIAGGASVEN